MAHAHGVPPAIPGIEIADDGDARGVRRPDGESHAVDAVDGDRLRTEAARQLEVATLAEQMKIEIPEQQSEGIRIFRLVNRIRPRDPQPIGSSLVKEALEQTGFVRGLERRQDGTIGPANDIDFGRTGEKGADDASLAGIVRSEHGEGIVVRAKSERARRLLIEPPDRFEPCLSHGGLHRLSR